ncbi:DUF4244 domain-containing protein [Microbacterium sp. ABRD28]|nr:DUF4244 domain-containing protein [Microbacterium sp. ABRD28]
MTHPHDTITRPIRLTRRRAATLFTDDTGAATAEYAIATMAIVAASRQN